MMFELAARDGVRLRYGSVRELRGAYDFAEPQSIFDLYYEGTREGATVFLRVRARESQHQLPGLSYQIMPEAMMRLLVDEPEVHRFVDAAGGGKNEIFPQHDLLCGGLACGGGR